MAIVTTKEPLNYAKLNTAINSAQGDYKSKVMNALQGQALTNVQYTSDKGRIGFVAESESKAVVSIVEINKQGLQHETESGLLVKNQQRHQVF